MSLGERQQRAYDARQISVLEQVRAGTDPFTAAINAIKGVRIPYNKGRVDFGEIFGGIVDGVASYFGVNTTSLTNLLRGEGNYNIAGGTAFGPGGPVAFQLLAAQQKAGTPGSFAPIFIGSDPTGAGIATGSSVPGGNLGGPPPFASFWEAGESAPKVASATGGGTLGWVALSAVGIGAVVLLMRGR